MRKLLPFLFTITVSWLCLCAQAAELRLPEHSVAGESITIGTTGEGEGVLYRHSESLPIQF